MIGDGAVLAIFAISVLVGGAVVAVVLANERQKRRALPEIVVQPRAAGDAQIEAAILGFFVDALSDAEKKCGYVPDPHGLGVDVDWVAFDLLGLPHDTVVHTRTKPLDPEVRARYIRTVERVKHVASLMATRGLLREFSVSFHNAAPGMKVKNPPTLLCLTPEGAAEVLERKVARCRRS